MWLCNQPQPNQCICISDWIWKWVKGLVIVDLHRRDVIDCFLFFALCTEAVRAVSFLFGEYKPVFLMHIFYYGPYFDHTNVLFFYLKMVLDARLVIVGLYHDAINFRALLR